MVLAALGRPCWGSSRLEFVGELPLVVTTGNHHGIETVLAMLLRQNSTMPCLFYRRADGLILLLVVRTSCRPGIWLCVTYEDSIPSSYSMMYHVLLMPEFGSTNHAPKLGVSAINLATNGPACLAIAKV
jgi:hypothetical protein